MLNSESDFALISTTRSLTDGNMYLGIGSKEFRDGAKFSIN